MTKQPNSKRSRTRSTRTWSVRARLIALVAILVSGWVITVLLTSQGFNSTKSRVHTSVRDLATFRHERDGYEGWLTQDDQSNMYSALASLHDNSQKALLAATWAQVVQGHDQAVASLHKVAAQSSNPQVRALTRKTLRSLADYSSYTWLVRRDVVAGDTTRAIRVMSVTNAPASNATQADFNRLGNLLDQQAAAVGPAVNSTVSSSLSRILLITFIFIGLAIIFAFRVVRSIVRPLHSVTEIAARCADGDLTGEITVERDDEIGKLAHAFQVLIEHLREVEGAAKQIAAGNLAVHFEPRSDSDSLGHAFLHMRDRVVATLQEITRSSETVSMAATQMAATSTQAGRALGDISEAVEQGAVGAQAQVRAVRSAQRITDEVADASAKSVRAAVETRVAAEEARDLAREGLAAASRASEAMQDVRATSGEVAGAIRELSEKSNQIATFVETITGIASQTNLLALNAAIEAARAGEQGRGFAVVAEEVRQLAEESQKAAATISTLIDEIQAGTTRAVEIVELGSRRTDGSAATVQEAGEAFGRIGSSVEQVTVRIAEIAAAIQQIADSGGEMRDSIGQVAAVAEQSSASTQSMAAATQQTSAGAQEVSANAQQLAGIAQELEGLVGQFVLR